MAVLSYRLVSYWLPVAAGLGPAIGMLRGRPSATLAHLSDRQPEAAS
jgi:hypothetical protein